MRLATVRLSNCTASFVSPDGLMLTNHHCVERLPRAESRPKARTCIEDGFIAGSREQELRCPTQSRTCWSQMEDVTAKVDAATRGSDDQAANEARKKR